MRGKKAVGYRSDREANEHLVLRYGLIQNIEDPLKARAQTRNMRYKFGISLEQWLEMYDSQGGVCGACGESVTRYAVDHDHGCCDPSSLPGSRQSLGCCIRALLCLPCNLAEGNLRSPEQARKLADYMEKSSSRKVGQ